MNIIDVGENVSGERVVVSDFEFEEPNCMNGVPWISYADNGEECNEPIFISFKDLATLFRVVQCSGSVAGTCGACSGP